MPKDLRLTVFADTGEVFKDRACCGIAGENLQGNIIVEFKRGFVDGTAYLEVRRGKDDKGFLKMDKVGEIYQLPIKSSLLCKTCIMEFQIRITQEGAGVETPPVFKSRIFELKCREAINAIESIPDQYPQWIDIVDAQIADLKERVDNVNGMDEESVREIVDEALEEAKQYTDNEIATFDFVKIVDTLPEVGLPNREYFVRKESADTSDLFDEYAWINKGTEEEPNYGWEFKGTKQFEIDLSDYVKFTDLATNTKAGVVKVESWSPVTLDKNGFIIVQPTTKANIDERNRNRLLRTSDLDYAWKVGATTNTEEWTDEEKALARALLGAIGDTDIATQQKAGLVAFGSQYGMQLIGSTLAPLGWDTYITKRQNAFMTYALLDKIVNAGLADCKQPELWTDDSVDENGELVKGTKTKARELIGAVGFTDYATNLKAGVVKVIPSKGISLDNGALKIENASENLIIKKTATAYPLTPAFIDLIMKVGLTTNTITLTDEEKASALEWLGVDELIASLQAQIDALKG